MRQTGIECSLILVLFAVCSFAQTPKVAETGGRQPLYRVTIVSRSTKALNYGYLTTATRIGFAPTPLLTGAQGEATIEPDRGATRIRARFSEVPPPQRFGAEYLTYVVWAITPDGRAQNLGELTLDASGKGKLNTSTPLQTFAMIVTAEPYYSVTQPSDVVVMENVVIPGTVGKVEEVNATYELLPRKSFTWSAPAAPAASGKLVTKDEYEAMLALYQAQNAIRIAEAQNAARYAPERLARARQLFEQARGYPAHLSKEIVAIAREATQVAEDGRLIATKRAEAERVAEEEQRALDARKRAELEQASREIQAESQRARTEPARVDQPPLPPQPAAQPVAPAATSKAPIEVDPRQFSENDPRAMENRRALAARLRGGAFPVIDTPRGLVITLPDVVASSAALSTHLASVASAIRSYRNLHVEVEAHSDRPDDVGGTQRRADAVRAALIAAGVPADVVVARGIGNARPLTSNASASGRARNRRIEILIAGDAIGFVPGWDRRYTITPAQSRR